MENIFVSVFEVESEAYQALSELKNNPGDEKSIVSSAVLINLWMIQLSAALLECV